MEKNRIALLCHRKGNIGHLFMAIGVKNILKDTFKENIEINYFEQHNPFEVYPKNHWLRYINFLPHGKFKKIREALNKDSFKNKSFPSLSPLKYKLAIACGGPNIVKGAYNAPEMGLMLQHLNAAFKHRKVPLLDIGVGSCFPLEKKPKKFIDQKDRIFYSKSFDLITKISVRDKTAKNLVNELGFNCELIPCAAIASGRSFQRESSNIPNHEKYIAINFQRDGSNSSWGQGIDSNSWLQTMRDVISRLEIDHKIILLAHSKYELKLARRLAPHLRRVQPKNSYEYSDLISRVKLGLVSRIHAAIPLAGIGVPSIVIGTDTRIETIDMLGLPNSFVKKVNAQWLLEKTNILLNQLEEEKDRLIEIRESTIKQYSEIIKSTI
tara:strand:+ start:5217 stop:6359 length:1143 start_codon:yes stop_codon:yes gene_type:complete